MKRISLLLASLLLLSTLSSCITVSLNGFGGLDLSGLSSYSYENADEYTMGGTSLTEPITALEINWVNGSVNVHYTDTDTVTFSETANQQTDEKSTLYHRVKDGCLTIHFAKNGRLNLTELSKDLTVTLPAAMALTELSLDLVSSSATVGGLSAERIEVSTVSGNVTIDGCEAETLELETVSGRISAPFSDKLFSVDCETVSGNIELSADAVGSFGADTVSGDVTLTVHAAPGGIDFDSTSGDLILNLPEEVDLTVEFDSVSGKASFEQPLQSSADGRYVLGDGGGKCEFDSISGDLYVRKVVLAEAVATE